MKERERKEHVEFTVTQFDQSICIRYSWCNRFCGFGGQVSVVYRCASSSQKPFAKRRREENLKWREVNFIHLSFWKTLACAFVYHFGCNGITNSSSNSAAAESVFIAEVARKQVCWFRFLFAVFTSFILSLSLDIILCAILVIAVPCVCVCERYSPVQTHLRLLVQLTRIGCVFCLCFLFSSSSSSFPYGIFKQTHTVEMTKLMLNREREKNTHNIEWERKFIQREQHTESILRQFLWIYLWCARTINTTTTNSGMATNSERNCFSMMMKKKKKKQRMK